jgi:hypothetical protein
MVGVGDGLGNGDGLGDGEGRGVRDGLGDGLGFGAKVVAAGDGLDGAITGSGVEGGTGDEGCLRCSA